MSTHTLTAVQTARERIAAAVADAEHAIINTPHIGRANSKTRAVNEGTSPLVTCSARACATCGCECYAVWHIDNVYPAARKNHAENTVARRRAPYAYYNAFFAAAVADGVALVRVNETGDFETASQLRALFAVARKYPAIQVIGYTRREALVDVLQAAPANVHVRYSLYRDGDADGEIIRRAGCAAVSDTVTTCPAQIAAAKGLKWSCADCAAHHCGCAGKSAVVIFKAH